jgi:hypothetical protein
MKFSTAAWFVVVSWTAATFTAATTLSRARNRGSVTTGNIIRNRGIPRLDLDVPKYILERALKRTNNNNDEVEHEQKAVKEDKPDDNSDATSIGSMSMSMSMAVGPDGILERLDDLSLSLSLSLSMSLSQHFTPRTDVIPVYEDINGFLIIDGGSEEDTQEDAVISDSDVDVAVDEGTDGVVADIDVVSEAVVQEDDYSSSVSDSEYVEEEGYYVSEEVVDEAVEEEMVDIPLSEVKSTKSTKSDPIPPSPKPPKSSKDDSVRRLRHGA